MEICIDKYKIEKKHIVVSGWMLSKDPSFRMSCNKSKCFKTYVRNDINMHYNLADDAKTGFEIKIPLYMFASIKFVDDKENKHISISFFNMITRFLLNAMNKFRKKIKEIGFYKTCKLCIKKILPVKQNDYNNYKAWRKTHMPLQEELIEQKKHTFSYQPSIAIVVPTYNTPITFLKEMVDSVMSQTYSNWELCIVDGASDKQETLSYLKSLNDTRIKVKYLPKNLMISGNTNEAFQMVESDFVVLLDHDDLLAEHALYEVVSVLNEHPDLDFIYSDEDKVDYQGKKFSQPHFKPDFAIDNLRSYNYITHLALIRKQLLDEVGYLDSECDGAQDFDLFLRICDATDKIYHIPKVLYHWRMHAASTSQDAGVKSYVLDAGKLALRKHLKRNNLKGEVSDGLFPTSYRIKYEINGSPCISILIPNKDHITDLKRCIESIKQKSSYHNYEIIIVENNSEEQKTFDYYDEIASDSIKVVVWDGEFNYSKINNFGRKFCRGDYLLLLNNDIEVISPDWLQEMLMICQREDVGAVGSKLYYPDGRIQHAGVIVGIGSVAGHSHKYFERDDFGYMGRCKIVQDLSAVTAACLMVKSTVYDEVNGLDEKFAVAFNDVDFCLKIRELGYLIVFTPYAELYHYESLSRGSEDSHEKVKRFQSEIKRFEDKWGLYRYDPFYSINLTQEREDFSYSERK